MKNVIRAFLCASLLVSCAKQVREQPIASIDAKPQTTAPRSPLETVFFDFDSSRLNQAAKKALLENVKWLKANKTATVSVEGHCDERGSEGYNDRLGKQRAKAVRDFLVKNGVKGSRLIAVSYGETSPADPGHYEDAWAKNRRVEGMPSGSLAQND